MTTLQASGHHASTFQQSLTIVLPRRRQPNLHLCSSRSVMGCLGTGSSSHLSVTNQVPCHSFQQQAVPRHRLSSLTTTLLSWQTPHPFCPVPRFAPDLSQTCRWPCQSGSTRSVLACSFAVSRVIVGTSLASSSDKASTNASTCLGSGRYGNPDSFHCIRLRRKTPSRPTVGPTIGNRLISHALNNFTQLVQRAFVTPLQGIVSAKQHQ